MPRSSNKKEKGGRKNVLNMMGYAGEDDDGDDDMDAELAAILGKEPPKTKKKSTAKLLDWSIIDAQVASSMKDVDEDGDDDVTDDDEMEFMSELNDLVEDEEPSLLKPVPQQRTRSPSPQPKQPGDIIDVLKSRKDMYEKATANAKAKGESAKVRRLQRGAKTIESLLRTAKAGKPVSEEEIPPMVATGQTAADSSSSANPQTSTILEQDIPSSLTTETPSIVFDFSSGPQPVKPPVALVELDPEAAKTSVKENISVDVEVIQVLEERKLEYRDAALHAKKEGDKDAALKYFKALKQFDLVLGSAKEGQAVDLSKMPPSLKKIEPTSQSNQPSQGTSQPNPPSNLQSKPRTVLEALEQRMLRYKSSADEATKEGNGGKARRMSRIVKQYQDAIKAHKAGRNVNFEELPVPPGFPPIPGVKEFVQEENIMQKATALIQEDVDAEPGPSKLSVANQQLAPPIAPRRSPIPKNPSQARTPSPRSDKSPSSRFDQQVVFLENRQKAFKQAALAAKKRGDRAAALDLLRKTKGFDEMIEAAKCGLKVDITKVPQPPMGSSSSSTHDRDEGFDVIESHEIPSSSGDVSSKHGTPEEDDAMYSRLLNALQEQIKKARAYAQQMTHSGDVGGAERCDRLAMSSQDDYDYVRSCRQHKDMPPRFRYEEQKFEMVKMNPDIGSNEMELEVIQCIDLHSAAKDGKIFVEWEMPFPHDNPVKGRTEEGSGSQTSKFSDAPFRVSFNRKLKSNHRAIKNKAIKLVALQKGGFLRSDKSLGTAAIKLNPMENHCELHAVEELKDGRKVVGKIEVFVRLRVPLLESDSQSTREKWLCIDHAKRSQNMAQAGKTSIATSSPKPSGRSSGKKVNIASLEVLGLELKLANAKIANCKKRGSSPPNDVIKEVNGIQQKIDITKKYLQDGDDSAKKEYLACLSLHYQHLTNEAQVYVKQGKRELAKLALTKKSLVKGELEKYSSYRT